MRYARSPTARLKPGRSGANSAMRSSRRRPFEHFSLAGTEAGAENENAPGKINPQQQRQHPAKRPVNRVQRGEVFQVDFPMTSFPAPSRSTKDEATVTNMTVKGNSEKNALKANAPAHCAPSIRKNFLTVRQSITQPQQVSWPSLLGLLKGATGRGCILLATIIEPCLGDDSFMFELLVRVIA
jgi:hypothetical protein